MSSITSDGDGADTEHWDAPRRGRPRAVPRAPKIKKNSQYYVSEINMLNRHGFEIRIADLL
jgi:hypothetical protein